MQQVLSSELPRKRPWSSVAQLFVQRQTQTDRVQSREIVRREHLPLDDRKVNLHLVQPTRMHGRVDQDDPFVAPTHPLHRRLTTMRRTIIHDIKQPLRIAVRLLLQNLIHQSAKRLDPRLRLATPQNYPAMYVPCCQVLQRSLPLVFRFNPPAPLWLGRHFVMRALTCLNARLLVHAQHVILRAQRFAFPRPRIQVQDRPGLLGEPRVPRKNPVFVLPGLDRRFVQHPPDRAAADLLAQRRSGSPHQVGKRLATERFFRLRHHLTSHRLDQRLIQRGEKRPFGHGQDDLRRRNRRWPNDFANVVLVERTDRPPRPPRRFPGTVAHEAAAQAGSIGRLRPLQFGGPWCRWPLAENHRGRYRERASVQAWRHPFLAGLFGESTSLYQKSAESATLFVKRTTTLGDLLRQQRLVSRCLAQRRASQPVPQARPRGDLPADRRHLHAGVLVAFSKLLAVGHPGHGLEPGWLLLGTGLVWWRLAHLDVHLHLPCHGMGRLVLLSR